LNLSAKKWFLNREMLINYLCGMKRKARGAQELKHANRTVEVSSAAQDGDSPAQAIKKE